MSRRIVRSVCQLAEVPPYCFLRPGVPFAEAVAAAVATRRFDEGTARITLLWVMRAVADHGADDA